MPGCDISERPFFPLKYCPHRVGRLNVGEFQKTGDRKCRTLCSMPFRFSCFQERLQHTFRSLFKETIRLPDQFSCPSDVIRRTLVDLLNCHGKNLISDFISGIIVFQIGGIRHKGKSFLLQISYDFSALCAEQGTDNISPRRRDSRQAFQAAAAKELIEDRLRAVVPVMGHGNLNRFWLAAVRFRCFLPPKLLFPPPGLPFKYLVPKNPAGLLLGYPPFSRLLLHIHKRQ